MESEREFLDTDLTSWVVGPYHAMLPGPMRLHLELDGEIAVTGRVETGYTHRGLEKTFELHSWQAAIPYADRLDHEGALFGELVLCMAVEEIGGIVVPPRARSIRVILSELSRVSAHLGYITRIAKAVDAETLIHYVLRDREKILDLFELLTGVRYSLCFLRYGGVAADVTEGFIERLLEVCDLIRVRLKEYNDLFSFNHSFLRRAAYIGVIHPDSALRVGMTGPNLRASGVAFDVRRAHPYSGYENLDFDLPVGKGQGGIIGDAHDRYLVRLREISQSLEMLKHAAESIPPGEFNQGVITKDFKVPIGESYARVESSRGLLGCHVISDGTTRPARVQFRAPSSASILVLPELMKGARLGDLPVILASLDIAVSEVDR